jgi:hypothetical protein
MCSMTHPTYLREKARELRIERKLSLLEIAERLALPKTTVFYWIRDLPDPKIRHRDTPARVRARANSARRQVARYKALREAAYERGWDEYPRLAQEPTFIDFVCMYIGEGYKRNRNTVALANSDPRVVRLADYWIRRFAQKRLRTCSSTTPTRTPTTWSGSGASGSAPIRSCSQLSASRTAAGSPAAPGGASTES